MSTKINGLPLQSIILKAALLPDFGNDGLLEMAARRAGEWLQHFHRATATMPAPFDADSFLAGMEKLCSKARKNGLPAESTEAIFGHAHATLGTLGETAALLRCVARFRAAQCPDFGERCRFLRLCQLRPSGHSLEDVAIFLAAIEALEKYPFCDRRITTLIQDTFMEAYGVSEQEQELLSVLKMKVLLQMFAQGRAVKESGVRKQVMWANVMKRFIQQATERSMARAA